MGGSDQELSSAAVLVVEDHDDSRELLVMLLADAGYRVAATGCARAALCKVHRLDPETYLRDLFRVLAHWPKNRYLELAPKYWASTRARLDPDQLAREFGPLTVPPTIAAATEQQGVSNAAG